MADGYQIVAQRQSVTVDRAAQLRDVMEVTFQTTDGTTGTVRIPLEGYSAAAVASAIAERVGQIAAVAEL